MKRAPWSSPGKAGKGAPRTPDRARAQVAPDATDAVPGPRRCAPGPRSSCCRTRRRAASPRSTQRAPRGMPLHRRPGLIAHEPHEAHARVTERRHESRQHPHPAALEHHEVHLHLLPRLGLKAHERVFLLRWPNRRQISLQLRQAAFVALLADLAQQHRRGQPQRPRRLHTPVDVLLERIQLRRPRAPRAITPRRLPPQHPSHCVARYIKFSGYRANAHPLPGQHSYFHLVLLSQHGGPKSRRRNTQVGQFSTDQAVAESDKGLRRHLLPVHRHDTRRRAFRALQAQRWRSEEEPWGRYCAKADQVLDKKCSAAQQA